MSRFYGLVGIGLLTAMFSGCAMCCTPYDGHYGYRGGKWQRDIPDSGRVGSAFDPAGANVGGETTTMVSGGSQVMMDEGYAIEEEPVYQEQLAPQRRMTRASNSVPARTVSRASY